MKNLLLLVVFLMFLQGGIAQNAQSSVVIDSLLDVLNKTSDNSNKAQIFYELASNENNPQQRFIYADSGFIAGKKGGDKKYEGLNLFRMGNSLIDLGKLDSALLVFNEAVCIADNFNIPEVHYEVDKDIAYIFEMRGQTDSALYYYERSYSYSKKLDKDKQLYAKYYIADILRIQGRYEDAMLLYLDCLELNNGRKNKIAAALNNGLGTLHFRLKNYDESEKYFGASIKISDDLGLKYLSHTTTNNLAQTMLFHKTKSNEVIQLLTDLLNNNEGGISDYNMGLAYTHLCQAYIYLNDLDNAKYFADMSITNAKKLGNKYSEVMRKNKLANILFLNGEYQKSIILLRKNIDFLENRGDIASLIAAKEFLVNNQLHIINNKQLTTDFEDYIVYKDSLYSTELAQVIKEAEEKYESQQKENKILTLSNENTKKEAQLNQARFTTYGILGLLILIIGLGYLLWFRQKQKQKLALLESAVTASETEKNRIGRELHDGIAGSILKIVYETENNHIDLSNNLLETYNRVRNLSHQLDGTPIHGEMFFDRLIEVIPENTEGQIFNVKLSPNNMELHEPTGTHVYRIVQELITNNLKHAKATKTDIGIELENDVLSIIYNDNGVGTASFTKGNGYHNLENRVELMKGSFEVSTKSGMGFEVVIKIPLLG